jgi:hypothetical protein
MTNGTYSENQEIWISLKSIEQGDNEEVELVMDSENKEQFPTL